MTALDAASFAELDRTQEGIALATLDPDQLRRVRASMGFFRDRRPDLYGTLGR
jgi:N-carbamoylputrescine amidase